MKNRMNISTISMCATLTAAALVFSGCAKYKLVAVEDSAAGSTIGTTSEAASAEVVAASSTVTESSAASAQTDLPTSDIQESVAEATETVQPHDDGKLQIVVLGDSIFDNYRTPTGIASLMRQDLNADVYNMAVAGSTAGLAADNNPDFSTWTIANFIGVSHVLTGDVNASILDGHAAAGVLKTFDPAKTDYFIVEFGINDFLSSIPREPDMAAENMKMYSYRGGLENGITALKGKFPDATVILMTPGYTQFWNGGSMIGDCNTIDRGYGRLIDYTATAVNEAQALNIPYINSYEDVDINGYNASDCLQDGIHPTDEGCRRYADAIEKKINELEAEKNGTTASTAAANN